MFILFLITSNGGNLVGQQVCFFAIQKDMDELFNYIYSKGGIVINEDGNELNEYDLAHIMDKDYLDNRFRFYGLYIKISTSKIIYDYYPSIDRTCLCDSKSDVLQLSIPQHMKDMDKYEFQYGRVYLFGIDNGNTAKTVKLYDSIKYYIRKNYIIGENKWTYIGKNAYEQYKLGKYIPCCPRVPTKF